MTAPKRQLLQDQTAYAETLRIALEHEIARLDGLAVPIDIMIDAVGEERHPLRPVLPRMEPP